jgi:hypothetical protein
MPKPEATPKILRTRAVPEPFRKSAEMSLWFDTHAAHERIIALNCSGKKEKRMSFILGV